MTIGKCIRELLEGGSKVVFPGFGSLNIGEARRGTPLTGSQLDPPGKKILFDSTYSKDDGELARAWARAGELDEEEARQQVLELVDAIRFALDKGERYTLIDAGEFRRDDDGKVHFSADRDWLLEPGQFGLEPMELLELDEEEESEENEPDVIEAKEPAVVAPPPAEVRKERTPPPYTAPAASVRPVKDPNSHRKTRLWRILWIVAGLLIIVLAVLIFVPTEKLPFLKGDEPVTAPIRQEQLPVQDEQTPEPAEESGTPDSEEGLVTEESDPQVSPVETPVNKYFLIAGSFRNVVNASELQDKLKAMGYAAEVIATENRMYRVSVASFATEAEAERELAHLKSVSGMESTWLLVNE